jgi:RimJ/RimL family protein N-acetyltransferase
MSLPFDHSPFQGGAPVAPVTLQGRFARLEPLTLSHAPALVAASTADPAESYPYTFVPRTLAEAEGWISQALAAQASGAHVPFATVDAQRGVVVGSTRFGTIERWSWQDGVQRRPAGNPDVAEIGWTWLSRAAQRTPINTEAKLLMLGHAFEQWKVFRMTLKTDARNQRSRDAIARLGARFDGVLRAWQTASDGGPRDTAIFSMLASEWPAAKARLSARLDGQQ